MTVLGPGDPEVAEIERARAEGRLIPMNNAARSAMGVPEEEVDDSILSPEGLAKFLMETEEVEDDNPMVALGDTGEVKRVIDLGPYCVECREDTTGQKERQPAQREALQANGDGEDAGVEVIVLAGWMCEECKPFEHPLTESIVTAMGERRYDPAEVRRTLRRIGEEKVWKEWAGPMLDVIEVVLGLERR